MGLRVAQAPAARARDSQSYLLLVRDGTCYGVPAEIVRGLSDEAPEALPTCDLLTHFPGCAIEGHPSRLVRCGRQQVEQAILVDEVLGLLEHPPDQIQPLPALFTGPERMWFSGFFLHGPHIVLVINPGWLLLGSQPSAPGATDGAGTQGTTASEIVLEEAADAENAPWAEL